VLSEEFRALKNLNLQTELLEVFDWDEEARDNFNVWLIDALNSSFDIPSLLYSIKTGYGEDVMSVVKKIFKSEIDNISDDKIKKGEAYEA
tara:strand:- start:285 stop:554 length:270 start_codon:yes stop_codon:yes gene_type:complete